MAVQEISALPCGNAFFVFVVMHSAEDSKARFKPEILSVCTQLGGRVRDILEMGEFPLILGGDYSIAMGSVSGAAAYFRAYAQDLGLIWFDAHGDSIGRCGAARLRCRGRPPGRGLQADQAGRCCNVLPATGSHARYGRAAA